MDKKTKQLIKELATYAWPEASRGPANKSWIAIMKRIADVLDWMWCPTCKGECMVDVVSDFRKRNICTTCYTIGKVDPDNY